MDLFSRNTWQGHCSHSACLGTSFWVSTETAQWSYNKHSHCTEERRHSASSEGCWGDNRSDWRRRVSGMSIKNVRCNCWCLVWKCKVLLGFFEALFYGRGTYITLVWISKPFVSYLAKEAMSLLILIFVYCMCIFFSAVAVYHIFLSFVKISSFLCCCLKAMLLLEILR